MKLLDDMSSARARVTIADGCSLRGIETPAGCAVPNGVTSARRTTPPVQSSTLVRALRLKESSPSISPASTIPPRRAAVIPLKSP
jgi:hypothetical protein